MLETLVGITEWSELRVRDVMLLQNKISDVFLRLANNSSAIQPLFRASQSLFRASQSLFRASQSLFRASQSLFRARNFSGYHRMERAES